MARIRILLWACSAFSKLLLRCSLFILLVSAAAAAVVVAGMPDDVLRGNRSDFLAVLVAGSVLGVAAFLANLVAGLISNQIQRWSDRRLPAVQEFFHNHDLAELTGRAIGMILETEAKSIPAEDRGTVEWLAKKAPSTWTRISTSSEAAPAFKSLFERNLTEFVRAPMRRALTPETWKGFIREVAGKDPSWSPPTEVVVLEALSRRFSEALREALKHDFVADGRAYAALQLDIATSLLQQVTSALAGIDKAQEALSEIRQMASRIERGQLAAGEASDRHHREVQARFTHAIGGIDQLLKTTHHMLTKVEESHVVATKTYSHVVESQAAIDSLRERFAAFETALPGLFAESVRAAHLVSAGAARDFDSWIVDLATVLEGDDRVRALKGASHERSVSDIKQDIEKRRQARTLIAKDEATRWKKIGALSFQSSPSEALSAYQQAVELDAADSAAWRGKAASLDRLGRPTEALESTAKALELSPNDASCWSAHAYVLGTLKRHEEALAAYERALATRPDDVQDWSNKGFELAQVGRIEQALEAFERAISLDSRHAMAWTNKGWALGELGILDAALEAQRKAVEFDPQSAPAWANLGATLDRSGRVDDALAAFDKSIALDPRDVPVWVDKAAMLRKLNRLTEAEDTIQKALDLRPEDSAAWTEKGSILAAQGQFDDAMQAGERGVALDPTNAVAWFNLGSTSARLRKYEEAARAFAKAVDCDASDADAWSRLGRVLGLLGRFDESLEKLTRATELAPGMGDPWADRGRALAALGRLDEALDSLDRAATLSPGDAAVWRDKGNVLAQLLRFEEALVALGEATKLDPKDAKAWLSTGTILGDAGRFGDAANALQVAVQLSPDDPIAWNQLGLALGAAGAFSDALVAHDKALDLDPNFAGAWNARGLALASLGNFENASHSFVRAIVITPTIADTWLNRARKHVAGRRWFAHLLVVGQVVASHKRDITTVEKLGEILQAWADEFSDDPVVQGELVFGLYESMLAPRAPDFDRAAPYFDRVNRALRRSAMDSVHMIELGVRILNMSEGPELVNFQRTMIALLTNYWPGFTPNSSSPTPLAISYAIRSMDGDANVVYDSRDAVAKAQSIRQRLESSTSNGELPDAAQLTELWNLRMHLEDRGDTLLEALQDAGLSRLIEQYHQDLWRGEAATWPMCNHEGGASEAVRQQPKSSEGGQ
jgi:tetratricopeptide (TPR) repeat protein